MNTNKQCITVYEVARQYAWFTMNRIGCPVGACHNCIIDKYVWHTPTTKGCVISNVKDTLDKYMSTRSDISSDELSRLLLEELL